MNLDHVKKYEKINEVCKNKVFFCVIMPPKGTTKISLKFTQYHWSIKAPATIYSDLECVIEKKMDAKIIQKLINNNSRWFVEVKVAWKKFCKSLEEHEKFFKNDTDSWKRTGIIL